MGSFNSNLNLLRWNIIAVCILYNTFFRSSVENASCLQFNLLAHFIQWRQHFAATIRAFLQMHLHRKQKYTGAVQKKGPFSQNRSDMSPWLFLSRQRCAWWTVVPTDRASAVCVSARKAGQDQNVSRGTVTHAASTTESAERASVTATRAGRVNTALSVSHSDTYISAHLTEGSELHRKFVYGQI